MKATAFTQKLLGAVMASLLAAMVFQGCITTSSGSAPATSREAQPQSEALRKIDHDIEFTKNHIRELEKFKTSKLHEAVYNEVQNERSRGWVKLDGQPTYEEIAERANAEVAATEKEIQRLENKLLTLEAQKSSMMNQSSGCFLPETFVKMEDGSEKALAQLRPGDKVVTYDIGKEKPASKPVIKIYSVKGNHLYTINRQLRATGGERLLSQEGWKKIRDLKKGDLVHIGGKMQAIETIDYVRADHTLYNIQVADTHNFYVITSDGTAFLVHNSGGGGGSK